MFKIHEKKNASHSVGPTLNHFSDLYFSFWTLEETFAINYLKITDLSTYRTHFLSQLEIADYFILHESNGYY